MNTGFAGVKLFFQKKILRNRKKIPCFFRDRCYTVSMKDKENQLTKGSVYRFDYLSRMGRFHYQNVRFVRYVGPFRFKGQYTWSDNDIPAGEYSFVNENNEPVQIVDWMINEKTAQVEAFGKNERNFLRQDW